MNFKCRTAQLLIPFRVHCTHDAYLILIVCMRDVRFMQSFVRFCISTAILHMRTAQSAVRNQSAQSLRFAHCNCNCNCNLRLLARCKTTIIYAFISRFSFLCSSRTERNVPLKMIHRQQIEYFTKKIWEKNQQKEARLICHRKYRTISQEQTHAPFVQLSLVWVWVCV